MNGQDFLESMRGASLGQWERTFVEAAKRGELTPWPWIELPLTNGTDTAILSVAADVLSIGPIGAHLRVPLTPSAAQDVCNLFGWILPTPWLVYQIWRASLVKLTPTPMVPNKGANLAQYAEHSGRIDQQVQASLPATGEREAPAGIVSGAKKDIVVSNIYQPKKVLIFGWYRPEPDIYSDKQPMGAPKRQPTQPLSNVHGDFYVDYSHGPRAIAGTCSVNGALTATEDVYKHPTLSKLVSIEGPLRMTRYPASIPPQIPRPPSLQVHPAAVDVLSPNVPSRGDIAMGALEDMSGKRY